MNKFKHKYRKENNICTVIDYKVLGMSKEILGKTLVVFKFDNEHFNRVMEHIEFYQQFDPVNE